MARSSILLLVLTVSTLSHPLFALPSSPSRTLLSRKLLQTSTDDYSNNQGDYNEQGDPLDQLNPIPDDVFDFFNGGSSADARALPNAEAEAVLLALKDAWGGEFFGAESWIASSSTGISTGSDPEVSNDYETEPLGGDGADGSADTGSGVEAGAAEEPAEEPAAEPAEEPAAEPAVEPTPEWRGVAVDTNGNVVGLELPEAGIAGPLLADMSRLVGLTALDLRGNSLTGPIPPGIFSSMPNLEQLVLSGNKMTGEFPWSELHARSRSPMVLLELDGNNFVGEIPDNAFANATQLHSLSLSGNQFSGGIPSSLGSCQDISIIILSGNQFTGGVPTTLSGMAGLEVLDLSNNKLTGSIPEYLGRLPIIVNLDLSHNWLGRLVPESFSEFGQSLRALKLSSNILTGPLPKLTHLGRECEEGSDSVTCYRFSLVADFSSNFFEGATTMDVQVPGSAAFPKDTWICPEKDYGEQFSLTGNCLTSTVSCEAVQQRKEETCAMFCGAGSKRGQCGGAGVCVADPTTIGPNVEYECMCNSGYVQDAANKMNCVRAQ